MWEALGALPERQRAALVLRYYEDLTEPDVAAVLGCSAAAAKSLIARGTAALRTALEGAER
jgi:RNA polymerase sigma factor (sigma-70 family)